MWIRKSQNWFKIRKVLQAISQPVTEENVGTYNALICNDNDSDLTGIGIETNYETICEQTTQVYYGNWARVQLIQVHLAVTVESFISFTTQAVAIIHFTKNSAIMKSRRSLD